MLNPTLASPAACLLLAALFAASAEAQTIFPDSPLLGDPDPAGQAQAEPEPQPAEDAVDAGVGGPILGPFQFYDDRDELYFSARGGLSQSSFGAFGIGATVFTALGVHHDTFRVEGELGYRYHDVGSGRWSGDSHAITFMANGLVDADVRALPGLAVHLGLGLGLSHARVDARRRTPGPGGDFTVDRSSTDFVWQVLAGGDLELSDSIFLTGGYRLQRLDQPHFGRGTFHSFELGVRLVF